MAYLSDSFDFEQQVVWQNSSNWNAVHEKRSFVARKLHKINKVSVVFFVFLSPCMHASFPHVCVSEWSNGLCFVRLQTVKPILRALCRRNNAVTPAVQHGSALDPDGLSVEELENMQNEYIERKLSQAVVYDDDDDYYYSDAVSLESGLGMSFEELRPERRLASLLPDARLYMSREFWFESDVRHAGRPSFTRQQTAQRQQPASKYVVR